MQFKVSYYYLATGMEGHADQEDYGIVEANSVTQAKDIMLIRFQHTNAETY